MPPRQVCTCRADVCFLEWRAIPQVTLSSPVPLPAVLDGPVAAAGSQLLHLADDSACAAGCLLHLGGTAQPCHAAQAAAQDGPLPVHLFSLARGTWQRLAVEAAAANGTVPIGRHSFGAVTRGAQVVLAGGASSRGVLRDVWSLKVSSTAGSVRAERLADLPEARTAHTLTRVAGDRGIVLVGGASDLAMRNVSAACWSLDERGDAWTETARLPEARAYHAAVSTQDGLVVWAGLVAKVWLNPTLLKRGGTLLLELCTVFLKARCKFISDSFFNRIRRPVENRKGSVTLQHASAYCSIRHL